MSQLKTGEKIKLNNTYEVLNKIGDGGFGLVYCARNIKTNRKAAIKLSKNTAFSSTAEARMYWERERDVSKAVSGYAGKHMEFIEAYEDKSDRANPKYYLVLDFIDNATTLKNWFNDNLRTASPLGIDEIIRQIFVPVALYMAYAQKKGGIHRDFSFNNVIVVKESEKKVIPVVIDWGSGKLFDPKTLTDTPPLIDEMEGSGTVIITPGFFAPEIIMQKPPLPQTDIYMFGAVLFFALTNGYTRVKPTINSDYVLHPQDYNMNISDTLNDIVEKCTQYEPRDRFRTFEEVTQALQRHLDGYKDGLDRLPAFKEGNSFVFHVLNNNAIIPLNPIEMSLEDNRNLRIGRENMVESAPWNTNYQGVFRGVTRCKDQDRDRDREQFFLGYSRSQNKFFIHEGRNSNPTLLDGQPIPANQWIPITIGQKVSIKSTTVRGIFELINELSAVK